MFKQRSLMSPVAFPKDRRSTKMVVAGIYILELTQTILMTRDAFNTYAIHYGDASFLNNIQLLSLSIPIFSGLSQSFIAIMHIGSQIL